MRKFLLFFLLCLIFQSEGVNANAVFQDDPQFQINPGKADVAIPHKDKEVAYRIQVKAEPSMKSDLNLLKRKSHQSGLVIEKHNGLYKYLTAPIANHHEAIQQLKLIQTYHGFENSFIVVYRNEFRINADGSQSVVQYVGKEKSDVSKKRDVNKPTPSVLVSVNKTMEKPLPVKSEKVALPTIKEKILGVVGLPFTHYSGCTVLSILSMLLLNFACIAVLLLIYRSYIKRKERNHEKLKDVYAECLAGFICDASMDPPIPEPLLNIRTRFQKNLFLQVMMIVLHNMDNGADERIKALYYKLELQYHSIRKLKRRKLVLKVSAMRELAAFNVSEAAEDIEKYIYHKNRILRQEAIRCLAQPVILEAMLKLGGDTQLLNLLSDIVLKSNDMEIRLQAAKALVNIGPLGVKRMQILLLNQDKDIETIYKLVTDALVNEE